MKKPIIIGTLLIIGLLTLTQSCFYSPRYIYRVVAWQDADYDDFEKFKYADIKKAHVAYKFINGTKAQTSDVVKTFEEDSTISNLDNFLKKKKTHSFIVIRNDTLLYENYFSGNDRNSLQTSFSVSKSILSLLMGIAIHEGAIGNIEDPITKYVPELEKEDIRFRDITIMHLLKMQSGLSYSHNISFPFVTGDSPKTYYHPNLRKVAIKHSKIEQKPGIKFKYNNYNALLIGLVLERTTGKSISKYLESKLWQKIGTEYDATWSTDENNFEKMESGFNARAIDFAKIGKLALDNGKWQNNQIVQSSWIDESIQPKMDSTYQNFSNPKFWTYNYLWWGIPEKNTKSDFMAIGNLGQIIYVSPRANTIIVRNGDEAELFDDSDWIILFQNFIENTLKPKE